MSAGDAVGLVDAMRLFLARHEEALAGGDPDRGMEACEGLLEGLTQTLPSELASVAGPRERQVQARAVVERRAAELEGLAMQLKLAFHQLREGNVDVLRLVALLTATRRQLRALSATLALWGAEHGGPAAAAPGADDAMRAAREALNAGCALAAREAMRVALARADRRAEVGAGEDLVSAWAALDAVDAVLRRP